MATINPFDLLGDDDAEDPSLLIAAQQKVVAAVKKDPSKAQAKPATETKPAARLPSKPLPPDQSVREFWSATNRGGHGGGRGGFGRGRGNDGSGGGYRRDSVNDENSFSNSNMIAGLVAPEDRDAGKHFEKRGGYGVPRGSFRGGGAGRRGGFNNGEAGNEDRPRRAYERHSGTGHRNELKRDGAGRGNWGTQTDELALVKEAAVNETEKDLGEEKPTGEGDAVDGNNEAPANEPEEKEPEDKEMTLEEYEKVLEEKRKALQALKTEERKVDTKEFEAMQQISNKKENFDVFIKLGSDKDKRKEAAEREERAPKAVSINEFLKPAEGERYYGGRGRGRGRGSRGGYGRDGPINNNNSAAPSIEDPGQFPTLGGN